MDIVDELRRLADGYECTYKLSADEIERLRAERNDLAVDRVKLGVELTQTRRERDALRDKLIAVDREARMMLNDWDRRSSGPAAMRRIMQLARIDAARKGEA